MLIWELFKSNLTTLQRTSSFYNETTRCRFRNKRTVSRVPHCRYLVDNNQYSRSCVIGSYWSSLIGRPLGAVAPTIWCYRLHFGAFKLRPTYFQRRTKSIAFETVFTSGNNIRTISPTRYYVTSFGIGYAFFNLYISSSVVWLLALFCLCYKIWRILIIIIKNQTDKYPSYTIHYGW